MKTSKENAQDRPAFASIPQSAAEQTKLQQAEEDHWETLITLLAQFPVAVLPAAAPRERGRSGEVLNAIASKPLLKPEPAAVPITITSRTAEQYPLPSNVPSAKNSKRDAAPAAKPAAEQPVQAKPQESAPHPAEPRNPIVLPSKPDEGWAGKLSQQIRTTLDRGHTARPNSIKSTTKAEVAYNPDGHVSYVTYTVNAPARKQRRK